MKTTTQPDDNLNTKTAQILWIGKFEGYKNHIIGFDYRLSNAQTSQDGIKFLNLKSDWDLVILEDLNLDLTPIYEQLKNLTVLAKLSNDTSLTLELIKNISVFRFFDEALAPNEWKSLLGEALDRSRNSHQNLKREVMLHNKELESLNLNLEKMVAERTFHIEVSKNQESEKLKKMRDLIKFIQDLSSQYTVDDLLLLIRKETRKFHKLGDPFLVYQSYGSQNVIMSFRSSIAYETLLLEKFEFPTKLRVNDTNDSQFFANVFGRPFHKVVIINMNIKVSNKNDDLTKTALCFEHFLEKEDLKGLVDFVEERIQPIGLTFDRILLEQQMMKETFRWEKTFDGIQDPIAIIDVDHKIVRANKSFSQFKSDLPCFESFALRKSCCDNCPLEETIDTRKPTVKQITIGGKIFEVHSYPISSTSSGAPTNVVNHYFDITEARDLYSKVIQSEKIGAIGLLAGNIAHELNNPLTGIRSLSQTLLHQSDQQSQFYSDLVEIEKAAARSQRIIKNLLDFSKKEGGGLQHISLDEIVNRTLPMLKTSLRNHRNDIQLKTENYKLLVEPNLIQQVVFNLINNSCQAMLDPGQISIETLIEDVNGKNYVQLKINDSGQGIPESLQAKIFEPFFTTKKEGIGTGLGLSVSRSIIEKFNGFIDFTSAPGKGTEFRVHIPVSEIT